MIRLLVLLFLAAVDAAGRRPVDRRSVWRLAGGNPYTGNRRKLRALRLLAKGRPHSISLNEGYGYIRLFSRLPRYRAFYAQGAKDRRRGGNSNPILVRRNLPTIGVLGWQTSKPSTPLKIAPERWITVCAYELPGFGKVAHVTFHPHAGVRGLPATVDRVAKYGDTVDALDAVLTFLGRMNVSVAGFADVQIPQGYDPAWRTPYDVFERHGLVAHGEGVDVTFHDEWLEPVVETIPKSASGSDHPMHRLTLRRRVAA